MVRDGLFIFNSVHKVMSAEKILKEGGINARVMPVPRQLSSDCGLAIAFPLAERGAGALILQDSNCEPEGVYRLTVDGDYAQL